MLSRRSCARGSRNLVRIKEDTTCIDLSLDIPIICLCCSEKQHSVLSARRKKQKCDDSLSSERSKCKQPWVKRSQSSNDAGIYDRAWEKLVSKGYPSDKLHASLFVAADESQKKVASVQLQQNRRPCRLVEVALVVP